MGTHRSSDSSFNFTSPRTPRTPEKTDDGYPIYKIRFFDALPTPEKEDSFSYPILPQPPVSIAITNEDGKIEEEMKEYCDIQECEKEEEANMNNNLLCIPETDRMLDG